MGAGVDRQVCDYESCTWSNERLDVIIEGGRDAESIREVLQIRHPASATGRRNPLAAPTWVTRLQRGKDIRAGQSFQAVNRASTDFDSVPVNIGGAIRPADDDGHGPFRRLFWRPFESSGRRAGFGREQETWLDRFFRSGIMVCNNDSCSDGRDRVKISCEIHRQPHTTRRGWIAGQVSRVHRDAGPGKPLHVRHLRTFINARFVTDLLLQYRKYAGRGALPRLTCACCRSPRCVHRCGKHTKVDPAD
jgi:hypothetical protein